MPFVFLPWLFDLASGTVLLFWILLVADRKRRWPAGEVLRPVEVPRADAPEENLLVVVPARNEADALRATLPALLGQAGSFRKLVLVDDRSSDGTGEVAAAIARGSHRAQAILVVSCDPPPPGWSGKVHALEFGLAAALEDERFDWVLFTDADIFHPGGSIRALVQRASEGPFDLVSVMVRLRAESFWEKLLIPPFVYFFQLLYPFRRVADPRSRVAAAAGGCVLLRGSMLERIGGLESIHDAVIDDVALARRVKRSGGRCWLGLDPQMRSVRPYDRFQDIAGMVARTAFVQLGFRYSLLFGTLLFLGLFFTGPPVLLILALAAGKWVPASLSLLAWALQALSLLPAVRHLRVSALYAATLPASAALYGYMTAVSALRHLRGTGMEWRGRPAGRSKPA
jgi:hopene-associated glycosyltransferase HpnB